ncbi:MAG: Gfo/Idh/MocA family oxidoreductase [Granulosicoccus sp.]
MPNGNTQQKYPSPLRVAVIGTGYLGRFHAQKYAALDSAELVAICDLDAARAQKVATEVGTVALSDHHQLKGICDAVSIASPTRSHFAVAHDCLKNGLHVLVEKPMTVTTDEAQTLVDIAAANKLILQVGHLERFNPALLAVADQIVDPIFIESHRLAPFTARGADVNVVLDLMIHDIDILLHLVPSEVAAIHANGAPVVSDAPDIANVRIEFANGCVANVTASRVSDKRERRMRFFQKNTYIAVDFQENKARVCRVDHDAPDVDGMPSINCVDTELEKGDAIRAEIEAFLHAIRTNTRPLVSGQDGLRALQAAIAIGEKLGTA